jgi:MFS transporter, YQGE family, putative transporter
MFSNFLEKELDYFKKLHTDTQKLLTTILIYYFIGPMFGVFINAFLWRQSHDVQLVAFANVIMYLLIPAGFYFNGLLLRRYSAAIAYASSLLILSIATGVLMFLPRIGYLEVFLFSVVNGIFSGAYWANRNLLTLKTTTTDNRIYFSSIESSISNISKIVIPFLIGWFIVLGDFLHWYSPLQGYQMLIVLMFFAALAIWHVSRHMTIKTIPIHTMVVKQVSEKWKHFRWLEVVIGINDATKTFIPVLLVLSILGQEETLGSVQSFSAILAPLVVYLGVKSLHIKHRFKLIALGVVITLIGAVSFGITYSGIGVLIFVACQAIAWPFLWVAINSINYDLIDQDNKEPKHHYAYICDQEMYLNAGRVAGILLFIGLAYFISNDTALRFAPLVFAIAQLLLFSTTRNIEKK